MKAIRIVFFLSIVLFSQTAYARNILFVSDTNTDTGIVTVLNGEGHTVTTVLNDYNGSTRPTLAGSLSAYDAVFWSTSQQNHTALDQPVLDNLVSYAQAGGYLFITGADGVIDNYNPDVPPRVFLQFLGSYRGYDNGYDYMPIANVSSPLTTGVIDIRGLTPRASSDSDSICGPLAADTSALVQTDATPVACGGNPSYSWALRQTGNGYIAYVQSGNFVNTNDDPVWTDTTMWDGNVSNENWGEYNAAVRNFAFNAHKFVPQNLAVPSMTGWGMIIFMLLSGLGAVYYLRRRRFNV